MPATPCPCRRCEQTLECLTITFLKDYNAWDADTTMSLCQACYEMYNELYEIRVEDDEDDEAAPSDDE
jgi:hypothetical protein